MRRQHTFVSILSALVLALVTALTAGPASAAKPTGAGGGGGGGAGYPTSIASLGDSITRGFNAGGWYSDWPSRSWSTGSDSAVTSHYTRLSALNRKTTVRAWNDADTGAKMGALAGQALEAKSQGAKYATVLMGANDACTSSESTMTSVETFRSQFSAAMTTLMNQATPPKVLVASIPDIYQLWQVGKGSSSARNAWNSFDICQSMLANPQSTDAADEARRQRVRQRVIDFNTVLQQVCATHSTCKYDGGAVFGYQFKLSHLSTWDYFHPNTSGQAVLADVTWRAGFWPTA
jgi:lysophospholipase L1-like esterase